MLCPACDEVELRRQSAIAQAHARGYASVANTPEYKRMQHERDATQQGRTLRAYVSKAERERHALFLRADREAHRVRRRYFRAVLLGWNRMVLTSTNVVEENRKRDAAKSREYYHQNLQQSRRKTAMYKAAHPEWAIQHQEMRTDRIKAMDDGTLTVPVIRQLKALAQRCAYCDGTFVGAGDKQTDHMVALCHGGEHSRRNVVIVCRRCNGRKARLTYAQWLDRVDPQHLERAVALFQERYGLGVPAPQGDAVDSFVGLVAANATRAPLLPMWGV
jgi:5-methylcytosine-specific restriction endonuclease McrA